MGPVARPLWKVAVTMDACDDKAIRAYLSLFASDARGGPEVIFKLGLSFFDIKVPISCQQPSMIRCWSISKSNIFYKATW